MHLLLELLAAEQLPAAQVLQLLLAVACVDPLAGVFSSNEGVQVHSHTSTVRRLCELPGAWDIEEHNVLQLLHVAIERQPLLLPTLLEMPSAQQLTPKAVLQLLQLILAGPHTSGGSTHSSNGNTYSCVQELLQLVPRTREQQLQQRLQRQNHSPSISPARLAQQRYVKVYDSGDVPGVFAAGYL
jgi:hypothetical protein